MDIRPAYPLPHTRTTTATPVEIARIPVRRGSIAEVRVTARAQRASTFGVAIMQRTYRVENNAGALAVRTDVAPVPDYNPNGYAIDIGASGENISITLAGAAGHTVDWDVKVDITLP